MPFDSMPRGDPWGDPWFRVCKSCRHPIGENDPVEEVRFEPDELHRLEELNGIYHAACARPYLSGKRALDMLSRRFS